MRSLNQQLALDLSEILREPSYIYVDSIEPERDRLPVSRGLIEGMIEAFELADKRITTLNTMCGALAIALSEILLEPSTRDLPVVQNAQAILAKVKALTNV